MKATDYKAIRLWGLNLGSLNSYIEREQAQALQENAPITAIFKSSDGWHCAETIVNDSLRNFILGGNS